MWDWALTYLTSEKLDITVFPSADWRALRHLPPKILLGHRYMNDSWLDSDSDLSDSPTALKVGTNLTPIATAQWWAKYYFQNSIFIFKIQNSILFCILKYFFQSILFCIFKILLKTVFQISKYFFQNTFSKIVEYFKQCIFFESRFRFVFYGLPLVWHDRDRQTQSTETPKPALFKSLLLQRVNSMNSMISWSPTDNLTLSC